MHVPIYWLVFHVEARSPRLEALHALVEGWLARRAPPPLRGPLLEAVGRLDVCFASVRELPRVRPRSVLGGPVGAEEAATLAQADRVLLARSRPRASPDFEALAALTTLGAAFAEETSGVSYDPQRLMLLPLDAAREAPCGGPVELAQRLGVPGVRLGRGGLVTEGLALFGLPELCLPGVEPYEQEAGVELLGATSRWLLEHGLRPQFELPITPDGLALEVTLGSSSTPSVLEVWPRVPPRALLPAFARAEGQVVSARARRRRTVARRSLLRRALSRHAARSRAAEGPAHLGFRRGTWQPAST